MTISQIANLMNDATEYPLVDRIAARIILEGYTEEDFWKTFLPDGDPIRINVHNKIRDFTRNGKEITPKLKKLAEQL